MVITVEIYKQIRKMRLDGMSQRQIAAVLHISRNTVKKYWDGDSVPWERKDYSREASVLTENVVAFVRKCLDEDTHSPKKQHHTARRIYDRLVTECSFTGGETTVRRLVKELREKCQQYLSHQIRGKESNVGTMLAQEKLQLYPLPGYPFDPCKRTCGRVDRFCTVRFDTNNYSVPAEYCGREVAVKAGPETVSIYFEGKCIAQHCRCFERKQYIYALEHYLPILEQKGRAIFYARPVQETLPGYFIQWLRQQHLAPKELIEILSRCRNEDCETIMSETACHIAPAKIEDTVVVQAVDLHVYDTFLCGKAGAAV